MRKLFLKLVIIENREIIRFRDFYIKKCINITIITPGIPKNPTISAVIHVILIAINPVRLIRNSITPPIRALINNFIIIIVGQVLISH